jgi:hypothetical protein
MPHLFNANSMPSSDAAPCLFSDAKPMPDGNGSADSRASNEMITKRIAKTVAEISFITTPYLSLGFAQMIDDFPAGEFTSTREFQPQ